MTRYGNLVRDYDQQYDPQYNAQYQKQHRSVIKVMPAPKKRIAWVNVIKRNIFGIVSLLTLAGLGLATVSTSSQESELNRQLQDTQTEIRDVKLQNENLKQNVQELTQYDRVMEIAEKYGLKINEKNVRNVAK